MTDQETIARFIQRELTDIPTARLRAEASREVGDLHFSAAARHIPRDEYFENIVDWQV